jgi:hypothetical protein
MPPEEITGLHVTLPYDGELTSPGDERVFVMETRYDDLGRNDWQTRIEVIWKSGGGWQTKSVEYGRVGAPDAEAVKSGDMLDAL